MSVINCDPPNLSELCRLCLSTEQNLVSVLELLEESEYLLEKIYTCLLVEISENDEVSRKVCQTCLDKIDCFYSFRHLVADSQEKLGRLLADKHQKSQPSSTYLHNVATDIEAELERELSAKSNTCWDGGDELVRNVMCVVEQPLSQCQENVLSSSPERCQTNPESGTTSANGHLCENKFDSAESDSTSRHCVHEGCDSSCIAPQEHCSLDESAKCLDTPDHHHSDFQMRGVDSTVQCANPSVQSLDQVPPEPGGFSLTSLTDTSLLDGLTADALPFGVDEDENCEDPLDLRCNIDTENSVLDSFSVKEKKRHGKVRHRCSGCSKTLSSLQGLLKHINKHHAKNHGHVCHKCNIGFKSAEQLKVHNWAHKEKYTCDKCAYTSHSLGNFKLHVMKHNCEFLAVCEECGKGFYRISSYEEHKANKHGKDIVVHKCSECGKAYHSRGYLKQHLKTHDPSFSRNDYQCETCGKTYLSWKGIRRHMASAHEGNRYRCNVCSKEVTSLQSLKTHEKIHTGEKSYVCDTCGKTFLRLNSLVVHRRVHSGEKPYSCDICKKSFSQRSTLNIHNRSHTGERPYPCHLCTKSFVTKTLRNSHLKTHQSASFE